MKTLIHVLAMAALVAGIVHITTVLLLPAYAQRDAWAFVTQSAKPNEMALVVESWSRRAPQGVSALRTDPSMAVAICRFDLTQGPVLVEAEGDVPFWSASVFDSTGRNVFSINDRTAVDDALSAVLLTPAQDARLREAPVTGVEGALRVTSTVEQGFVVLRANAPDRTLSARAEAFLQDASCEPLRIETG